MHEEGIGMKKLFFTLVLLLTAFLPCDLAAQIEGAADPGLQPGDLVEITVWQRDELSGEFTVAQDGSLVHPLYSQFRVTGLPADQVQSRLKSFLSQYEANPQVVVRPLYRVSVAGQVFRPDIYNVQPGTTVSQVITLAGGVTETADTDDAQLTRGTGISEIDLRSTAATQMPVYSGDQILVSTKGDLGAFRQTILPLIQIGVTVAHLVWWGYRD